MPTPKTIQKEKQHPEQTFPTAERTSCKGDEPKNRNANSRIGAFISSRDEMNLAEFPLTVLSTRSNPSIKTLEFRDSQRLRNGELVEREWIITGADKFGLPTSTDDDVVLGLICLSMEQGFRDRKVYFTRYELLRVLRWSTEGRSYSRITKSLDRLSGVRIRATNAFFDNSLKAFQTVNFGILDAYEINDGRGNKEDEIFNDRGEEGSKSFFVWSEVLFDSFKSGFIKKLDLDFYFSLRSAVSRRLYRYLDKHFYYRSTVERPVMNFAFEKLGLSRSYKYISSVKQQIEPACEELKACGYLNRYEYIGRGGAQLIRFTQARTPMGSGGALVREDDRGKDERGRLLQALTERGIPEGQGEKLLYGRAPESFAQLWRVIEYYDSLERSGKLRAFRNKVGFLYRSIQHPEKINLQTTAERVEPKSSSRPELKVVRCEKSERELLREAYRPVPRRCDREAQSGA